MTPEAPARPEWSLVPKHRWCRLRLILWVGLLGGVLGLWFFRNALQNRITSTMVLHNAAPAPDVVEGTILNAADPQAALLATWNSAKILQREVALRVFSQVIPDEKPLPPAFDDLLQSAALDPDANVRETALGILRSRKHPALVLLAAAQLTDPDPQVRLLGLNALRSVAASVGVPTAISILDDPDPLIVVTALKLLETWSGESFDVKLSGVIAVANPQTGLQESPATAQPMAEAGAERARTWWRQHQAEYQEAAVPPARRPLPAVIAAGDFELPTLEGRPVRLSDYRGKVVLINFWTTWCPACLSEMPELQALQHQHQSNLVVLGVSLDFVPDEHGDLDGPPPVEEQGQAPAAKAAPKLSGSSRQRIHDKVARTAAARKLDYPVLLDEYNEVGGRFNGGELPTTVIVDAQGNISRRFVGARSLPVFEAMIAQAAAPEKK